MIETATTKVWTTGKQVALLVFLIVWFAAAFVVGDRALLTNANGSLLPPIAITAILPVAVFLGLYASSSRFRGFVLAQDIETLTMLQLWRVIGFGFLTLYAYGVLPGLFALPAGDRRRRRRFGGAVRRPASPPRSRLRRVFRPGALSVSRPFGLRRRDRHGRPVSGRIRELDARRRHQRADGRLAPQPVPELYRADLHHLASDRTPEGAGIAANAAPFLNPNLADRIGRRNGHCRKRQGRQTGEKTMSSLINADIAFGDEAADGKALPDHHQADASNAHIITADDWFALGARVAYDRRAKEILQPGDSTGSPDVVQVFRRLVYAESAPENAT